MLVEFLVEDNSLFDGNNAIPQTISGAVSDLGFMIVPGPELNERGRYSVVNMLKMGTDFFRPAGGYHPNDLLFATIQQVLDGKGGSLAVLSSQRGLLDFGVLESKRWDAERILGLLNVMPSFFNLQNQMQLLQRIAINA